MFNLTSLWLVLILGFLVFLDIKWPYLVAQTVKHLPTTEEILGSIPGSGRSSEEENGNLLQYSCLENPMDRGAW